MALIFHSDKYIDIKLDSNMIIGITGHEYQKFLKGITGKDVYYIGKYSKISGKKVSSVIKDNKNIEEYLKDLGLDKSFLNKNLIELSHGEIRLLEYLKMLTFNASIIILDEPFMDLDYDYKKKVIVLLKKIVKKKTIILGSSDTNVIYTQCKKVLILGKDKFKYDKVDILANKNILRWYHLEMPEIIEFIKEAKDKKINLPYSKDIRDLIKDVYKNVSK